MFQAALAGGALAGDVSGGAAAAADDGYPGEEEYPALTNGACKAVLAKGVCLLPFDFFTLPPPFSLSSLSFQCAHLLAAQCSFSDPFSIVFYPVHLFT